jgi:hypothetical protein
MKDRELSYKEFISESSYVLNYTFGGATLFENHSNPNKFRELLNSKSTGKLI